MYCLKILGDDVERAIKILGVVLRTHTVSHLRIKCYDVSSVS